MTICFKLKDEDRAQAELDTVDTSRLSLDPAHSCLCLETYGSNYLGYPQLSCFILELLNVDTDILGRFHNISNTTLHEMVTSIINDWPPGLTGVSSGVFSVISDYIISMPNILPTDSNMMNQKYIQLAGDPWTNENPRQTHQLQMCLIACLIKVCPV